MIKILIIIVALLAGLTLAPELSANKGYILLSIDGYTTYETTIISAVLMAIIFYFVLIAIEWVLRKLLSMNSVTRGWFASRKTKKAQKNKNLGMLALFEGDDKQAHKLLEKSAPQSDSPALTYIAAARAAHNQGKYEIRDRHFQRAYDEGKGSHLATGLAWAELQIDAEQYKNAQKTLSELEKSYPKKPRISALYLNVYPALGEWQNYIDLLTRKRNPLSLSEEARTEKLLTGYVHLFQQKAAESGETLQLFWDKGVSRWMRKELAYQKACLDAQIETGNDLFAEKFLLDKLKKQFSIDLVPYISKFKISIYEPFVLLLEDKLLNDPDNALLHQTLAYLLVKEEKADSAIEHLQESIKTNPNVKDYAVLADQLQKQQRVEEANECYRLGLSLAVSEA